MPPKKRASAKEKDVPEPAPETSPSATPAQASLDATVSNTSMSTTSAGAAPVAPSNQGIVVGIRVRPFNKKELEMSTAETGSLDPPQPCLEVDRSGQHLTLLDPTKGFCERSTFTFDRCFSAFQPSVVLEDDQQNPAFDSDEDEEEMVAERAQAEIYAMFGLPVLESAWQGYNGCIFAYGQTSSGKTYTMMGTKRDPGIIPRVCRDLFQRIEEENEAHATKGNKQVKCVVSYIEIYNEQVKDLLKPKPTNMKRHFKTRFDRTSQEDAEYKNLKVRQHPLHGPFVDGVMKQEVNNWLDCVRIIRSGNEHRTSASTAMNDTSSRSHAIFQMLLTQTEALGAKVRGKEVTNVKSSKINLVDLAGSERITKTNVSGAQKVEATHINQSLSTLRKVIDVLVSKKKKGDAAGGLVVPYRESLLTWILSDNFGGNSKTSMIANVSPHESNYLETEGTLRYATLARGIVNRVRVNEDPSAKLIRELQAQLKALQQEMVNNPQSDRVTDLEAEMNANRAAMEELVQREETMREAVEQSKRREQQLLSEKEELRKDQEKWRREAERLKKEKEAMKQVLAKLGHANEFWMTEEEIGKGEKEESDSSCPPLMRRGSTMSTSLLRTSSMQRKQSVTGLQKKPSLRKSIADARSTPSPTLGPKRREPSPPLRTGPMDRRPSAKGERKQSAAARRVSNVVKPPSPAPMKKSPSMLRAKPLLGSEPSPAPTPPTTEAKESGRPTIPPAAKMSDIKKSNTAAWIDEPEPAEPKPNTNGANGVSQKKDPPALPNTSPLDAPLPPPAPAPAPLAPHKPDDNGQVVPHVGPKFGRRAASSSAEAPLPSGTPDNRTAVARSAGAEPLSAPAKPIAGRRRPMAGASEDTNATATSSTAPDAVAQLRGGPPIGSVSASAAPNAASTDPVKPERPRFRRPVVSPSQGKKADALDSFLNGDCVLVPTKKK